MDDNWKAIIMALISSLPACIAAVSSLRNGKRIDEAKKKLDELLAERSSAVSPDKNGRADDWPDYEAIQLW